MLPSHTVIAVGEAEGDEPPPVRADVREAVRRSHERRRADHAAHIVRPDDCARRTIDAPHASVGGADDKVAVDAGGGAEADRGVGEHERPRGPPGRGVEGDEAAAGRRDDHEGGPSAARENEGRFGRGRSLGAPADGAGLPVEAGGVALHIDRHDAGFGVLARIADGHGGAAGEVAAEGSRPPFVAGRGVEGNHAATSGGDDEVAGAQQRGADALARHRPRRPRAARHVVADEAVAPALRSRPDDIPDSQRRGVAARADLGLPGELAALRIDDDERALARADEHVAPGHEEGLGARARLDVHLPRLHERRRGRGHRRHRQVRRQIDAQRRAPGRADTDEDGGGEWKRSGEKQGSAHRQKSRPKKNCRNVPSRRLKPSLYR